MVVELINLDKVNRFESTGHSSKGNQLKWRQGDIWYKADYRGYEGLSEVVVSRLLQKSSITDFVQYTPVQIQYGGTKYRGCQSRNFLAPEEELITVDRLFRLYTGRNLTAELAKIPFIRDRILYMVENVMEFTGLDTFGQYLTAALELDAFFMNEDRHTNNIAVIHRMGEDGYGLCPYFDQGLSLLSDVNTDYLLDMPLGECQKKVRAKPFSHSFDEQLDEAEKLYGQQIWLGFGPKDIKMELEAMSGLYEARILQRAENLLYQQRRKYQYLFSRFAT